MSEAVVSVLAEQLSRRDLLIVLAGVAGTVVGGVLIRYVKIGLPRASGDAVGAAYEVLSQSSLVFTKSSESSGMLSHPWAVGDGKLEYQALDSRLVEVRDRLASRRFHKGLDEVRSCLQGVWTERAVSRAAVSHEGYVASAAELDHKSQSREKASRQVAHAQDGSAAVEQALVQLGRMSKRV